MRNPQLLWGLYGIYLFSNFWRDTVSRIRAVGKGSWKKTRGWKVQHEILDWSWKVRILVFAILVTNIHFLYTLASGTNISKSSPTSVSPFPIPVTIFQIHLNFPPSARTFQLQRNIPTAVKLSNFARFFLSSPGSFQINETKSEFKLLENYQNHQ